MLRREKIVKICASKIAFRALGLESVQFILRTILVITFHKLPQKIVDTLILRPFQLE